MRHVLSPGEVNLVVNQTNFFEIFDIKHLEFRSLSSKMPQIGDNNVYNKVRLIYCQTFILIIKSDFLSLCIFFLSLILDHFREV